MALANTGWLQMTDTGLFEDDHIVAVTQWTPFIYRDQTGSEWVDPRGYCYYK